MADNKDLLEKNNNEVDQPEATVTRINPNQPLDLNQNLGSFGSEVKDPSLEIKKDVIEEEKIDVRDHSEQFEIIKDRPVKVDFERFNRKKRPISVFGGIFNRKEKINHEYKTANSKLALSVDKLLRNTKTLVLVWLTNLLIISVIFAVTIALVVVTINSWKNKSDISLWNIASNQNMAIAGNIFGYIAMGVTFLPLFYLFITVLVGINNVYASRNYMYYLWLSLIISLVMMSICIILNGIVLGEVNSFWTV